jgi:hypothetical protein
MWAIALKCDLCGEELAAGEIGTGEAVGTAEVMERIRARAFARGGRLATAWDGPPRWLCPRHAGPAAAPDGA